MYRGNEMRNKRKLVFLFALVAAVFVFSGISLALTTIWDGDTDTNWAEPLNWDNGVPASGDVVVFPDLNYAVVNNPTISGAAACATISINSNTAAFTLTVNAALTMDAAGSISASGGANGVTITGTNDITASGAITFDNDDSGGMTISVANINGNGSNTIAFTGSQNITVSSVIADSGSSNPVSVGMDAVADVVTLSGANTYTGAVSVNSGTLNLQNDTAAGTTAGGVTVAAGAGLQLENTVTIGAAETLTLNGDGGAVIELESVSGSNRWQGPITLSSAAVDIVSSADNLYLSNTISGQNITFDCNTGDINATGVIGAGAITVTQAGTGTLLLGGDNTYTGALTIGAGGTVELAHPNAFGTGAGTLTIGAGGTLILGDAIDAADWDQPITLISAATINANYSGCEIDENITNAAGLLYFEGSEHLTVSGIIGPNGGGVRLDMTNEFDTITLTGANTYTGNTNIVTGTLNLRNDTAAGTTAGGVTITAALGGRLELQGGITVGNEDLWINGDGGAVVEMNNVSGVNAWNGAVTLATATVGIKSTAGTLTFGSTMSGQNVEFDCNTGDITVTGVIGTGLGTTLAKTGTGTLTLDGADNYNGATTVDAGTIVLNGVKAGSSAYTVNNAGTRVEGTGTIPGSITLNTGTILAPGGTAVGTLTVSGSVIFNGASQLIVNNANALHDLLAIGTDLTLSGTALIDLEAGESYSVSNNVVTIAGTYNPATEFLTTGFPANWGISSTASDISLTYSGGGAIPTLTEWGLILFSLLLAAFAIRTMKSKRYDIA